MDFRFILIAIITFVMGIGVVALLVRAWRGQRQANAARQWPQTMGRVIASGVREKTVRVRRSTSAASYRDQTYYGPQITYEYEVDGRRYQHDRLRMGESILTSNYPEAEKHANGYPIGKSVVVYYDPGNPVEATLDPRTGWGTRLNWVLAGILAAITMAIDLILFSGPPIKF